MRVCGRTLTQKVRCELGENQWFHIYFVWAEDLFPAWIP